VTVAVSPARLDSKAAPRVVVIGQESTGKSQIVTALAQKPAYVANFGGSTVSCDVYAGDAIDFVDTPGILVNSDSVTTQLALRELRDSDRVLIVIKATHIDESLHLLVPLAFGKRAVMAITFADKIADPARRARLIDELRDALGIDVFAVDGRRLNGRERNDILAALRNTTSMLIQGPPRKPIGWTVDARPTWLEHRLFGPLLAATLLIAPGVAAVTFANNFAEAVDPMVQAAVKPLTAAVEHWPPLLHAIFAGRYGLITMGPLMLIWAMPTVLLYAVGLGAYKASGLLDRLTAAMHPLTRPFGLSGRDVVRVLMGFGCNVPAVISTRGCSSCSRDTCISAIAFGSACSYQLGATLAVFAATGNEFLVAPYLAYLVVTTLVYVRLVSNPLGRSAQNGLTIRNDVFLEFPRPTAVWRECRLTIVHFLRRALPIFFVITLIASVLDWLGAIDWAGRVLSPLMTLFALPGDVAVPVLMASIRKDGIVLLASPDLAATMTAGQLLAAVYLAGVLLPCVVTFFTVVKERNFRFGAILIARQAAAALMFTALLAWSVRLIGL